MSKKLSCGLAIAILFAGVGLLHAKENPVDPAIPDASKGDPPPGNAMALSIPQARTMLKESVSKLYKGEARGRRHYGRYWGPGEVHFSAGGFSVTYKEAIDNDPSEESQFSARFAKETDYLVVRPWNWFYYSPSLYSVAGLYDKDKYDHVVQWSDEMEAQHFADAFNRLVYAAHHPEETFAAFNTAAKAWRDNPVKPPLSPEADRHWILAENAVKEKNLDAAVEHYEAALEIQPMWPTGWFDLAMIYAEQKNFADAADAMKHYLELTPDAPDAKDARTQMIIWEDKASKPQ
jgi:tetratricopeptide (TPR) repeat protein